MTARAITVAASACVLAAALVTPPAFAAEDRFDLDETYAISPQGTIELSTRDAEVTILGADRDDVHVEIHYLRRITGLGFGSGGFDVQVSEQDGDLRIRESLRDRTTVTLGMQRTTYEVLIEAPHGVNLKVQGDDDDYDISEIHGAIVLRADDGDVQLRDCRGSEFDLVLEDGHLDIDRGAGTLRLRYDDGDADIRGAAFDRVHVRANDGALRLAGELAPNGRYEFELDDGDMDLRLGEAGGEFSFAFGDGTLNLEGGSGTVEIDFDDGRARLSDVSFERLTLRANDGVFDFDAPVPPDAVYAITLDDGEARLNLRGGGGRVTARFDDGRVRAAGSLHLASETARSATYQWGEGHAEIDIDIKDGSVALSSGRR
jgi:hypothetical protein